jgi:CHASE3 domain sensor protein
MAQYIQTPDFSYEPLPMESYVQLAKEKAAGYAEGINSANAYLSSLPIATGALDDPNGDRASTFRDQYGTQVEDAIQLYMDTKDKRGLASALTNITRDMQSNEQLLSHNYLAANSDAIAKRHQDNPNGWYGYTKDGTADLYTTDEAGNRVSNLVSPTELEGLGATKNFYGNYLSGFDIAKDTAWIDKFGTTANKFIEESTKTLNQTTGKVEYMFEEQKYSNIMDYFKGNPSSEFMQSAQALYDSQSNPMTRAYKAKYGYEQGLSKFIEDSFSYRLPMEYSRGMDFGESAVGSAGLGGQTTPEVPVTEVYSADMFANTYADFGDALKPEAAVFVRETEKELRTRENETGKSAREIVESDPAFGKRVAEAQQALIAEQIQGEFNKSEEGKKLEEEHIQNLQNYLDIDQTGIWNSAKNSNISAEQIINFYARFELPMEFGTGDNISGIGITPPKPIGEMITSGEYQFLTDESKRMAQEVSSLAGSPSELTALVTGDTTPLNISRYAQNRAYIYDLDGQLPTVSGGVDDLFTQGILDPENMQDRKLYNWLKTLPNESFKNDSETFDVMKDLYNVADLSGNLEIGDPVGSPVNVEDKRNMQPVRDYGAGLHFDSLVDKYQRYGVNDTEYSEKLDDYLRGANVATGETLVSVNPEFQKILDNREGVQLAKDLTVAATDKDGMFFSQYDVYRLDNTDAEPSAYSRYKQSKVVPGEDSTEELLKSAQDDKGNSQVRITGYSVPHSDKLRSGIHATIGTTPVLIIPKIAGQPDKYTNWLNEVQTTITGEPVYPQVQSGPFAGQYGTDVLAYSSFHNAIVETGIIGLMTPNKDSFDEKLTDVIGRSPTLGSTGQKLISSRENTSLDEAIPVASLDTSELVNILNTGTAAGQDADITVNLGYGYEKEDGSRFTWQDYFEGTDQNGFLSLREADAIAQSLQITNDINPALIGEVVEKVTKSLQNKTGEDGTVYSVIRGEDFINLFEDVVGKQPDFTQQIRFSDANDAILMYGLKVGQYR